MAEPYFWYAVAIPAALVLAVAMRHRNDVGRNGGIWAVATILTVVSAYTGIRELVGFPPDPYGVYALPVFPVAYLIAGQYVIANAAVCAAGTFASLLATDLAVFGQRWVVGSADAWGSLVGIGAGRPIDGLVAVPAGAWAVARLVARLQRRGVPLRIFRSRLR